MGLTKDYMKISIIGCGNIGTGIAKHLTKEHQITLYDRDEKKTKECADLLGAKWVKNSSEAIEKAEVVILTVKPQNLVSVASEIANELTKTQVLISVLAGTPISRLKHYFKKPQILRIMPNLAIIKGKGVIGFAENAEISADLKKQLEVLFKPLGVVHWIPEDKFDALTALAASGPAFVCVMIEAMVDAAISMGISHEKGLEIVLQMLLGTITLLQDGKKHPAELKWMIATPGGTTIAGLRRMEDEKVRSGLTHAFLSAYEKALQLSKED